MAEELNEHARMELAVSAVQSKEMSIRKAASAYDVKRSSLHRRTSGQVDIGAKRGSVPILTEGEVQGILDAVEDRTARGQCFTTEELGMFVRLVVAQSPYNCEVPVNFPSASWVAKFIQKHREVFGRRKAQSLETCRAAAATEENVRSRFTNIQ